MNKTWIPTLFNVIRIFATPIVIYFILSDPNLLFVGILFVLVACTDMLDGVLARKLKVVNEKGARLDQVADRIFFTSVIFALIFKLLISKGNNISIGDFTIFFLLLSREIIAFPAFLYLLISNKEFVKVRFVGKITTVLQAIIITALIIELPISYVMYSGILVGFFGVLSGITYWYDVANARVWKAKEKYREMKVRVKNRIKKSRKK